MNAELLLVILAVVAIGVASFLLPNWSLHRRVLVLEQQLKTQETVFDERLSKLSDIVTSRVKSDAVKTRWSKRDMEDAATIKSLATVAPQVTAHPWDPRTWGQNGG